LGYGSPLASQQPLFNACNIVLLQDCICASTRAIFSELMRTVAGVETLAIGDLAFNKPPLPPMQRVGGTKGWLRWNLNRLNTFQSAFYTYLSPSALQSVNGTQIGDMHSTSQT